MNSMNKYSLTTCRIEFLDPSTLRKVTSLNRATLNMIRFIHPTSSLDTVYIYLHRSLVQTMMMTGSDLCSSTKPWSLQLVTLDDIYEEFHAQGDKELSSGRLPVPIMNRFCRDDQALHQVTSVSCGVM